MQRESTKVMPSDGIEGDDSTSRVIVSATCDFNQDCKLGEQQHQMGSNNNVDHENPTLVPSKQVAAAEAAAAVVETIEVAPVATTNKTPLDASIRLIETKHRKLRALRQINIVGRLNHSANRGILFIMADGSSIAAMMISSLLLLQLLFQLTVFGGEAALPWPFNGTNNAHHQNNYHLQLPSMSPLYSNSSVGAKLANWPQQVLKSRRVTRNSNASKQSTDTSTQTESQASSPQAAAPSPISQQFHYFWNHDQIEPKTMATEAQKILAEAQIQTDKSTDEQPTFSEKSDSDASPPVNGSSSIGRLDSLVASASSPQLDAMMPGPPIQVPGQPTVDQQLTSMVLQMQRQQQISMMMPRYEAARRVAMATAAAMAAAQALNSAAAATAAASGSGSATPVNPMSRYWMSDSSQHPVVALTPPHLHQPSGGQQSMGDPMQMAMSGMNAFSMAAASSNPMAQMANPSLNVGGVPVYGPFVVAPTIAQQALRQANAAVMGAPRSHPSLRLGANHNQQMAMAQQHHKSGATIKPTPNISTASGSPTSRFASSLLSRRKSWPFFGIGSGSPSSSELSAKSSAMQTSSSHVKPTVLSPPTMESIASSPTASGSGANGGGGLELPAETVALLDLASKQLANAIAGHVQVGVARRNLAAVLAQSIGKSGGQAAGSNGGEDLSSAASMTSYARHQMGKPDQTFSLSHRTHGENNHQLQPPYSLATSQLFSPARHFSMSLMHSPPVRQPFDQHHNHQQQQQQPSQHFDLPSILGAMGSTNSAGMPFGSRLKRRHLSPYTQLKQETVGSHRVPPLAVPRPPYSLMSSSTIGGGGGAESNIVQSVDKSRTLGDQQNYEPTIEEYYDNYPQIHITTSSTANSFDNHDHKHHSQTYGLKSRKQTSRNLVAGESTQRHVVKKDKPGQFDSPVRHHQGEPSTKSKLSSGSGGGGGSGGKSTDLRHLFMLATSENPMYSVSESQQDVQQTPVIVGSRNEESSKTSSDLFEVDESQEEQTQLRRLKRSIGSVASDEIFASSGSSRTASSLDASTSSFAPSSWKSLESSMDDIPSIAIEADYSKKIIPLKSVITGASSSWSPSGSGSGSKSWIGSGSTNTAATIGKRQAEITRTGNRASDSSDVAPLKVKQVTASASVIHNSASRLGTKSLFNTFASTRNFTPMPPVAQPKQINQVGPEQQTASSSDGPTPTIQPSATDQSLVDPMTAALSESARVVNYFQNVENEPASTTARPQHVAAATQSVVYSQQQQQQQVVTDPPPQSLAISQPPQLNVGFSAPSKITSTSVSSSTSSSSSSSLSSARNHANENSRSNEQTDNNNNQTNDLKRHRSQGNGLVPSARQQLQSSGGSRVGSSVSSHASQPAHRQQQADQHHSQQINQPQAQAPQVAAQQSSPAAAPNADISSAATSYTNNMSAALPASHSSLMGSQSSASQHQQQQASIDGLKQQVQPETRHSYRNAIMGFFDKQVGQNSQQQQQQQRSGNQMLPQTPMGSQAPGVGAKGGSGSELIFQKALISSLLELSNSKRRSSNIHQNSFMMPKSSYSHLQSQPSQPSNLSSYNGSSNQRAAGGFERSVAADQSSSYNDEVSAPQSLSSTSSSMDLGNSQQSQFGSSSSVQSNQDLSPGLQQSDGGFSSPAINLINQPQTQDNLGNGDGSFGTRNANNIPGQLDVGSSGSQNLQDPQGEQIELSRFNQQQQQHQHQELNPSSSISSQYQANQTSDFPPGIVDSGISGFDNQQVADLSSQVNLQPLASNEPSQLASSALQPPIMGTVQQQQQIYSQQLQALSAAVNGINQQALNQHQQQSLPFEDQQMLQQQHRQFLMMSQQQQQQPQLSKQSSGISRNFYSPLQASGGGSFSSPSGVEEEAAANVAAAAAGISSFPSTAQLLALQSQGHNFGDLNGMLATGSEKRESDGDGESEIGGSGGSSSSKKSKSGKGKKGKGNGVKQVSHHYHFNSLMSPFEDGVLDQSMGAPFNPLDIAGNLQQAEYKAQRQRAKANKEREQEEEEKQRQKQKEQEEADEKPKKKGFLRRFSIKNLFKRFRKDKSKGQQQQQQEEESGNDERGQDEKSNLSQNDGNSDERSTYERRSFIFSPPWTRFTRG